MKIEYALVNAYNCSIFLVTPYSVRCDSTFGNVCLFVIRPFLQRFGETKKNKPNQNIPEWIRLNQCVPE